MAPMKSQGALCLCQLVALTAGLVLQQADLSSPELAGSLALGASNAPIIVSGVASFPQESLDDTPHAESRAFAARDTLEEHEQVLMQLASQQAAFLQEQQRLAAKEDALLRKLPDEVSLLASSSSSSVASSLNALVEPVVTFKQDRWMEELITASSWLLVIIICGLLYSACFTYPYPPLKMQPNVTREGFSFHLCYGFSCDPDWRICLFGCCFSPVRWADSASSPKISYFKFLTFWVALLIFGVLYSYSSVTYSGSWLLMLVMAVLNRQRIRQVYGMPYGTCATCCEDSCVWCCCHPCATMQEAMEIEFVELPQQPKQASMTETLRSPRSSRKQQAVCC